MTWHDACHGLRDLNVHGEPRKLLRNVRGLEFVELANADSCCGFGGTFSVKYPEISVAILDQKIEAIEKAGVRAVVSGDASCLMQIGGRLTRGGSNVRAMHLAEVLAAKERLSGTLMDHQTSETFDRNAREALRDPQLRGALRNLATTIGERRLAAITTVEDWEGLRERARAVKDETLAHLDKYLEAFADNAERAGARVHWARDAARGVRRRHPARAGTTGDTRRQVEEHGDRGDSPQRGARSRGA